MHEIKRNIEEKINQLLEYFPVVIITGVRQSGKTTLVKKLRPKWEYFDLEKSSDFEKITGDFDFFFREHSRNIIIDEAQESPELFKELRSIIDQQRDLKNRFLITGSSSFSLLKGVSESLAGRVGIVELGTLKCNEYYQNSLPSFYNIFSDEFSYKTIENLKNLKSHISHNQVINFFLKGGYPEPAFNNDTKFHSAWMENYFQTYVQRDIRKLFPRLNILKYRRLIAMLTTMTGTIINRSDFGRSLDTSEVTIKEYLDIAHGSFIWRNILSYEKGKTKSIIKMPKGIFRDSGLAHYLQKVRTKEQLDIYPYVGASFESFAIEELLKGIEAKLYTRWDYYYYRTRHGLEVDLILEGEFGILPIEIKYGLKVKKKQIASLSKFVKDNNIPFGIIINNSEKVELLAENIIQIPVSVI